MPTLHWIGKDKVLPCLVYATILPPAALGENTKRADWEDHKENLTRRKSIAPRHISTKILPSDSCHNLTVG